MFNLFIKYWNELWKHEKCLIQLVETYEVNPVKIIPIITSLSV